MPVVRAFMRTLYLRVFIIHIIIINNTVYCDEPQYPVGRSRTHHFLSPVTGCEDIKLTFFSFSFFFNRDIGNYIHRKSISGKSITGTTTPLWTYLFSSKFSFRRNSILRIFVCLYIYIYYNI